MTLIRPAEPEDFERLYPLFLGFNEPRPAKETFRRLFVRLWGNLDDPFGYLLEDEGRPVGFLGTLFSQREIEGREEKFCNLTTWIVAPEYRSEGLSLLSRVLNRTGVTFTNFTGLKVAPILRRFGFQVLDERARILLPLPFAGAGEISLDPERIAPCLDDHDRRILEDHRPFAFPHLLLRRGGEYAYLIVKPVRRKRLPLAEVHYLSHPAVFARLAPSLLARLCLRLGVLGLLVGEHYLAAQRVSLPGATIPQRIPRLFRSNSVPRQAMDTLYSELQVLDL
ncbi:MAG: GNAT family N-acetyltransferase [Anaerolineales bacterium]